MELMQALEARQSCRKYSDRKVDREMISAVMEAGRLSPSACNSQRWMFVAVDDPAICAQLADTMRDEELRVNLFAGDIPAFVAIVWYTERRYTEKQKKLLALGAKHQLVDVGIACHQMCLAATDMGLGSLMIGRFREEEAKRILGVPQEMHLPLFIGLGYPAEDNVLREKVRYPAEEIIRWNSFAGEAGK